MRNTKTLRRTLVFVLLFVGFLATSSFGQATRSAYAKIPFEFWVGDTRLPAGTYQLSHVISPTVVVLTGDGTKMGAEVYLLPIDEEPVQESEAKLIFLVQNGNHYLYQVRGRFGTRILTAQLGLPEPKGDQRLEVPIVYR